jgi:hypothetical protein
MPLYKVRTHVLTAFGFLTQADHYHDYDLESPEPLETFAGRLSSKGFLDQDNGRWIMPGAIAWIELKAVARL